MPKVSPSSLPIAPEDQAAPPIPFERALDELETIVQTMEDGTLSLDQSLAAYRRGAELVKVCETALEHVKEQVRVLDGELLRPLSEMATRGSERP
ncbi:MAG: exodeoxyribonuclease VII small subunit [Burkholderiaceae bacterium]